MKFDLFAAIGRIVSVVSIASANYGNGGTNLLAGTVGGVFLSTDNGTSWNAVNTGLTNTYVLNLTVRNNPAGGTDIFAGTSNGLFLSTNNSTSWEEISETWSGGNRFIIYSFVAIEDSP